MKALRLSKTEIRIPEPDLHHEPRDGFELPFGGCERPEGEEQAGETDCGDAHEEEEFDDHATEGAGVAIV